MNTLKIAAGLAGSITLLCLLFALRSKKTEATLYDQTVATLMQRQGISSYDQLEASFPVLLEIKVHLSRISALKQRAQLLRGGPSPKISAVESRQLRRDSEEISLLRDMIKKELAQLLKDSLKDLP